MFSFSNRDRLATHGQHSTHLSHNYNNLHITAMESDVNSVSVFNVTSAGQCTGVEAAILDQRKLVPSGASSSANPSPLTQYCHHWLLHLAALLVLIGR